MSPDAPFISSDCAFVPRLPRACQCACSAHHGHNEAHTERTVTGQAGGGWQMFIQLGAYPTYIVSVSVRVCACA